MATMEEDDMADLPLPDLPDPDHGAEEEEEEDDDDIMREERWVEAIVDCGGIPESDTPSFSIGSLAIPS